MMLIKIAVYIVCAALSLPIFPYVFFSNRLLTAEESAKQKEYPDSSGWGFIIFMFFAIILASVVITYKAYEFYEQGKQIWYVYSIPFAMPIGLQFFYAMAILKKKLLPVVLPVLAIAFILSLSIIIRDEMLPYQELTYLPVSAESDEATNRIDNSIIQERYKTTMVNYQGHKDETDFYLIDGKDIGFGVLTVDRIYSKYDSSEGPAADGLWIDGLDGYSIIEAVSFQFYPCNYENTIVGPVRDQFKSEEIVSLGLIIDGETPYGKFGIIKRDGFFSRPQVECYVFLNMVTGEVKPAINESTTISI